MGIYRTALLVAVSHANHSNHTWTSLTSSTSSNPDYFLNYYNVTNQRKGFKSDLGNFHGNINLFLGGAMLLVISTIVCLICYCCHRKTKMRSSLYMQQRWLDRDYNMEVYSIEQYYDLAILNDGNGDTSTVCSITERPPSYECIMAFNEELIKRQNVLSSSLGGKEVSCLSIDSSFSKDFDINGNIAETTSQTEFYDHPNNTVTTSAAISTEGNAEEVNNNILNDSNTTDIDLIRSNGIIKLDMSRIMDNTGLPTYEAALKLKSSNYI